MVHGRVGTWDDDFRDYLYDVSWLRCDTAGQNCDRVASQILDRPDQPVDYRLRPADVGSVMRLEVTTTSRGAGDTTAYSPVTAVVGDGGPPVNLVAPVLLVGSNPGADKAQAATVVAPVSPGDVLSVSPGEWSVNDGTIVNWLRCDRAGIVCAAIPGADATAGQPPRLSYIVAAGDLGSSIRADVTATAFLGNTTLRTQAARVGADAPTTTGGGTTTPGGTTTTPKDRATVKLRDARVTGSGNTLAVYLSLGAAGKVSITADGAGTRLGKATRDLGKGRVAIAVSLSKSGRKALRKGKAVKAKLALTLTTASGDRGSLTQSITIRPASR